MGGRTRVVVLGGGYAGLAFVQGLRRAHVPGLEITLVDQNPFHTLLTETHAVAGGNRPSGLVEVPFDTLGPGVNSVAASVTAIDQAQRLVRTDKGAFAYDWLAFCLGGRDNDFGIPGVREHAMTLRGVRDAEAIRDRFVSLPKGGAVVVVGGGLTGVELAAEMALHAPDRGAITIVEASPALLPGLPPAIGRRARRRLGWLGVNVLTGSAVSEVGAAEVRLRDGSVLATQVTVWAAGVAGNPMVRQLGVSTDGSGRALVDEYLRSSAPEVYVLGDSAAYQAVPDAPALPPSAQLAEQMGFSAAADLASRLRAETGHRFVPHLRGVLCDLGGMNATGLVYRFRVQGILGALAKRVSVHAHLWRTLGPLGFVRYAVQRLVAAPTKSGYEVG